jgi:anti-sigma regulatory factor (Ser/Thr protein kinase)
VADSFAHLAYLYEDPDDYTRTIEAFALEGLEAGDAVLIAVPGANLRRLRRALDERANEIVFADMEQMGGNPARIIPFIADFLSSHRERHVRFVGEPIWPGRSDRELTEAFRHEALLNVAFANATATILCPYDVAGLDASVIDDAGCTHPELTSGGLTRPSGAYRDPLDAYRARDRLLPPPRGPVATLPVSHDLHTLRQWVGAQARAARLPSKRAADLVLAANEAVSNTLVHADGRGTARIWLDRDAVVCEIADTGRIHDPLAGRRAPTTGRIGGRGLWLINHLCDLVELRSGADGTVLRLHMALG